MPMTMPLRISPPRKNLRLLTTKGLANTAAGGLTFKQVSGGFLVQDPR